MTIKDFLSRLLYQPNPPLVSMEDYVDGRITQDEFQAKNDEWWLNPDSPLPSPLLTVAVGTLKDQVGFDEHKAAFEALAEVLDCCVGEEIPLRGHGQAGKNARKHPRVMASAKLDPEVRSQAAAAAAQGLLWMEECRQWCHDANLRTQIQKRVMAALIAEIAEKKTVHSPEEVAALARIGGSMKDRDVFVLAAMAGIVAILAKHVKLLQHDAGVLAALRELLKATSIFETKRLQEARAVLEDFLKRPNCVAS